MESEKALKKMIKKKPKDPSECVFCDILNNCTEKILYQDDFVFCFYDKRRKIAKEHILVCPKAHIQDTDCLTQEHIDLLNHIHAICKKMLEELTPKSDYRYDLFCSSLFLMKNLACLKRFGYHEPPINSIGHLHLHGVTLPIKDEFCKNTVYGTKLTSPEKLIEKIKLRNSAKKITDFFKPKEPSSSKPPS